MQTNLNNSANPIARLIIRLASPKSTAQRATLLPLTVGLACRVAFAQTATGSAPSSPLSDLVSLLSTVTFGCLVFGLFKPAAFTRLFKEKTSRGRVAGTFGGALLLLMFIGKLVAPPAPVAVVTAPATPPSPASNRIADERVRLAEERAKAAEARASKAENAAKVKEAKPSNTSESVATKRRAANNASASASTSAANAEQQSRNVSVQTIEGLGQREVGVVDDVHYIITEIETASSIGNDFSSTPADGLFYVVRVAAYNNDKETHNINTSIIKLLDDQDREFDPSSKGSTALVMSGDKTAELFSAQIQPGTRKQFSLVYDAPENASGLKLKIPGGFLSRTGAAILKAPK